MAGTTHGDPARAAGRPRGLGDGGAGVGPLRVARPRRRVSLAWVTLGVLLAAGGALVFLLTLVNVGQRHAVLVAARPVALGQVLGEQDLRVVRVAAEPGLATLPATARATVVGRPAAVPLMAGMPLSEAVLGEPAGLAAGQVLAGVALKPGQFPPGLAAGARVRVLATPAAGAAEAVGQGGGRGLEAEELTRATVVSVTVADDPGGGGLVVGLAFPEQAAGAVAGAAAAGRVTLLLAASPASPGASQGAGG